MAEMVTSQARILIIEDDRTLNDQLNALLQGQGYETEQRYEGRQGLVSALSKAYDLILLDVLLPGLDGFTVLSKLRKKRQTPVMMLTACGAEEERITGYTNGADDYLPKPFNVTELLLRIEAVIRRSRYVAESLVERNLITVADFRLDRKQNHVSQGEFETVLTPIEFKLLWALADNAGDVLSKPHLYQSVLNREYSRYDRSLDMHLSRVRRKLDQAGLDASRIETVHGEGYCFK